MSYHDRYKTVSFTCQDCGWQGLGEALSLMDVGRDTTDFACPQCGEFIYCQAHPTTQELRDHWHELDDGEKAMCVHVEQIHASWQSRRLREPDQLPAISAPEFVVVWHEDISSLNETNHDTTLYCGERIIWRQDRSWEHWREFIRVAALVKARYGDVVMDLIATRAALANLGGDAMNSLFLMDAARYWIFGSDNLGRADNWERIRSEHTRQRIEEITGYEIHPPPPEYLHGRPSLGRRRNEAP